MLRLREQILVTMIGLIVIAAPLMYQRYRLTTFKRLSCVSAGKLYRSGQMTVVGFEETVRTLGIRTVLNVQNEIPDPDLRRSFLDGRTMKEQDLCRRLGVRYVLLEPDLVLPSTVPPNRPRVIDAYLALMDDPSNYPILLHCKAGLHRTGVLAAVYRMEYDRWPRTAALKELKVNGFGETAATAANQYIRQYILTYQPRSRKDVALGDR